MRVLAVNQTHSVATWSHRRFRIPARSISRCHPIDKPNGPLPVSRIYLSIDLFRSVASTSQTSLIELITRLSSRVNKIRTWPRWKEMGNGLQKSSTVYSGRFLSSIVKRTWNKKGWETWVCTLSYNKAAGRGKMTSDEGKNRKRKHRWVSIRRLTLVFPFDNWRGLSFSTAASHYFKTTDQTRSRPSSILDNNCRVILLDKKISHLGQILSQWRRGVELFMRNYLNRSPSDTTWKNQWNPWELVYHYGHLYRKRKKKKNSFTRCIASNFLFCRPTYSSGVNDGQKRCRGQTSICGKIQHTG